MKVGSTKALNRWDLSSQHVTPTTASFLKVPINSFQLREVNIFIWALKVIYIVHANVAMLLDFVWQRSQPCGLGVNVRNTYGGGAWFNFACVTTSNAYMMHI